MPAASTWVEGAALAEGDDRNSIRINPNPRILESADSPAANGEIASGNSKARVAPARRFQASIGTRMERVDFSDTSNDLEGSSLKEMINLCDFRAE